MPENRSQVLVTDRRRTNRRRLNSGPRPAVQSSLAKLDVPEVQNGNRRSVVDVARRNDRRPAAAVNLENVQPPEAVVPAELTIEQRREIIDRRRQDRRRQIDPTTCERDYSDGEVEFMRAMDDYKRKSGRPFPTWSEVLEVVRSLGYRKVAEPSAMEWRTFGESTGSL
jgi:hypothetical protein